jgi:uncharacterized protein (TIGR02594 family)
MTTHLELLGQAASFLGVAEIEGAKHNPIITRMLRAVGLPGRGDETPWCAAFANAVLTASGIDGTGSARARSFEDWGEEVADWRNNIEPGDIVVLWRKKPNSAFGHVAFFARFPRFDRAAKRIWLLGGNQGNKVGLRSYPASRVVSVRRMRAESIKKKFARHV